MDIFLSTAALISTVFSGTTWVMVTSLIIFISSAFHSQVLLQAVGVVLIIVPIANHIGIFIAIRRHNRQVVEAFSGDNLSVIFRREKKAAIDMFIVIAVLLLCLVPTLVVNALRLFFPDKFDVLWLWSMSLVHMNSSINPVIYCVRKRAIRRAVKSMLSF